MAAKLGVGSKEEADAYAGVGTPLAIGMWFLFALICSIGNQQEEFESYGNHAL